jgi:hypothetical protein
MSHPAKIEAVVRRVKIKQNETFLLIDELFHLLIYQKF